jgi:hypothetical protein
VSSDGQVRTHSNKTTYTERHGIRKWKQRVLKQKTDSGGYKRICLWKDGKEKTLLVHRLVAYAFLPKTAGRDIVNHRDGNPSNNYVENLEWCTSAENNNHAFDNKLIGTAEAITLFDRGTGERKTFRSMSKASEFLGRNTGYVSGLLKKGVAIAGQYEIRKGGG